MAKGVYERTPEQKQRLADLCRRNCIGRRPSYGGLGKIRSAETRRKTSETLRKNPERLRFWLGKTFTPEHLQHLSESQLGRSVSEETRRKIGAANAINGLGRIQSEETRRKKSLKLKGMFVGAKSHLWKGGVTPINKLIRSSVEYAQWRNAVFTRDNWTCQKHGDRGGKLHPHHVLNFAQYPDLRFTVSNGITLCVSAHREFHKRFGRSDNTREQIQEFIGHAI
jgi:hypothetical protein